MNFSKEHGDFLSHYQSLVLNTKLENGTPSERADILRKTMSHLTYAKKSGLIQEENADHLLREYGDLYADIVDSFDEKTGLNNYAQGALALCSGNKNDSQNWQTSLTLDKLQSMPCIQKLVQNVRTTNEKLLPKHKKTELLPRSVKENDTRHSNKLSSGSSNKNIEPSKVLQPHVIQNSKADVLDQSKDSVMNLYGNQSRNYNRPSVPPNKESNITRGAQQSFKPENELDHRRNVKPLFSNAGASRNAPFEQFGSKPPAQDRNTREMPVDRKRFYNQMEAESHDPSGDQSCDDNRPINVFKTAKQQLSIDNQRKYGGGGAGAQNRGPVNTAAYGTGKKSLGTRRGLSSKFVPPVMNRDDEDPGNEAANTITRAVLKTGGAAPAGGGQYEGMDDDKLKGIEPKMIELIMNEIMDNGPQLTWDDVAGLEFAKKTIKEIVVWPMLRPDIFTGLRGPPKGLLLFGPPGTGKTLIGKCIASQSKSTFFCISASSLTSKWVGEGEKMVRALFAVARAQQPAVVFIDEIDSLLTQRTDGENEASRRIKTEFLVQLDGASTSSEDRLLVVGATNRPQEIDEAARRRFVKRLYIPLPEGGARRTIITNLLQQQAYTLADADLDTITSRTDGFSGADMATLCREAALGPIRDMSFGDIEHISADQVRPIQFEDFEGALQHVRPSVSEKDLDVYLDWNKTFGSGSR